MSVILMISLAIVFCGIVTLFVSYRFALKSNDFRWFDLGFAGGIASFGLGILGTLVQIFTGL